MRKRVKMVKLRMLEDRILESNFGLVSWFLLLLRSHFQCNFT